MAHLLNDKWTDEKLLKALREKSESDLEKLRKAVARLIWAELPARTYDDLKAINDAAVDNRIDGAISDYRKQAKTLMLSDELLTEALRRYEETRQELKGHVATVQSIIKSYPDVLIRIDKSNRAWFDDKQLDKCLTDKATFTYCEQDKAYYQKLGVLVDALNDLREFEDKEHITPFTEADTKNLYTGGIVNLFDRKTERYQLTRHGFATMKKIGLILVKIPDENEVREKWEKMRKGEY